MPVQVSTAIQELIKQLTSITPPVVPAGTKTIRSREVTGGVHFLYENVRNATEFRDQHLFIRRAIERFLHRRLRLNQGLEGAGKDLIIELINTRYLKNDTIPVTVASQLDQELAHYANFHRHLLSSTRNPAVQIGVTDNLLEIASTDLEAIVAPHPKEQLILDFTFNSFLEYLDPYDIEHAGVERPTFELTLLATIHRMLLKSDVAVVRHALFSRQFEHWRTNKADLGEAVRHFVVINQHIQNCQTSKTASRVHRMVRRNIVPYLVLRQALIDSADPAALVGEPVKLGGRIAAICQQQYRAAQKKLRDGVVRSIIFLLATKAVLALVLEIPYDLIVYGHIVILPLVINFIVPPVYMATLGSGVRTPSARNTQRIRQGVDAIVYPSEDNPVRYSLPRESNSGISVFNVMYFLTFLISFGLIVWALTMLQYNIVSALIFFIFLSTVSFLGFRVSQAASELTVIDERKGILHALGDFFYTPFVKVGQWLAAKYAQVNIISLVLDVLIELPLKTILRIFEQWVGFIREKREDIY